MTNLVALDKKLRQLEAAAKIAREQDRREAVEDLVDLRKLLPPPKRGPERARAAALLADLDNPRTLRALDAKTVDELVTEQKLPMSPSTARRLIAEHRRKPATKSQQRQLDLIAARIKQNFEAEHAHAWDIGKDFDRIAKSRLYRLTKHRTLEAWANAIFPHKGYTTLARYRRIARSFTRATAIRFGTEKLDLGLRYLDLTPANDRPAELSRLLIPVPGKGEIPFTKITKADLENAVAALTTEISTPRPARLPRGAAQLHARLTNSFGSVRLSPGQPRPTIAARTIRLEGRVTALFSATNLTQDLAARLIATAGDSS